MNAESGTANHRYFRVTLKEGYSIAKQRIDTNIWGV